MLPVLMQGLTVEWVSDPAGFAAVAPAWDELAALDGSPFLRHAWLAAWWEAFAADRADLRICLAWRGTDLAGGLALMRRGRRLEALADYHTPRFGAVARDAEGRDAVAEAALRLGASELVLPAIAVDDPLLAALSPRRRLRLVEPYMSSPIVDTTGDWAAYRALSKPRWGAPLERFRRKMTREHAAETTLVTTPGDLDAVLDRGFAVEASGWKGASGTAILSSPSTERFYRAVAHAFAATGELGFSWLDLDGRMAAFDFCLLHGNRLYLLKTGYDESQRRLAPGLVMRLSVLERCFAMGLDAHELLGGDDPWKLKFATSSRDHVVLRSFGRRPGAQAGYAYRRWARPALRSAHRRVTARGEAA
jgi:CelD/BcsL family acetyltransferase involved in cellulose biosynthesis